MLEAIVAIAIAASIGGISLALEYRRVQRDRRMRAQLAPTVHDAGTCSVDGGPCHAADCEKNSKYHPA